MLPPPADAGGPDATLRRDGGRRRRLAGLSGEHDPRVEPDGAGSGGRAAGSPRPRRSPGARPRTATVPRRRSGGAARSSGGRPRAPARAARRQASGAAARRPRRRPARARRRCRGRAPRTCRPRRRRRPARSAGRGGRRRAARDRPRCPRPPRPSTHAAASAVDRRGAAPSASCEAEHDAAGIGLVQRSERLQHDRIAELGCGREAPSRSCAAARLRRTARLRLRVPRAPPCSPSPATGGSAAGSDGIGTGVGDGVVRERRERRDRRLDGAVDRDARGAQRARRRRVPVHRVHDERPCRVSCAARASSPATSSSRSRSSSESAL